MFEGQFYCQELSLWLGTIVWIIAATLFRSTDTVLNRRLVHHRGIIIKMCTDIKVSEGCYWFVPVFYTGHPTLPNLVLDFKLLHLLHNNFDESIWHNFMDYRESFRIWGVLNCRNIIVSQLGPDESNQTKVIKTYLEPDWRGHKWYLLKS